MKLDAYQRTIFVESIVRDAINPLPRGQLRDKLQRVVTYYQYAINNKKDLVKRYGEFVRLTIQSGALPLLDGVYFNGWNGDIRDFCNCKKEVVQSSQNNWPMVDVIFVKLLNESSLR